MPDLEIKNENKDVAIGNIIDIARRIASGEEPSPLDVGTCWLVDMRFTGTGTVKRDNSKGEKTDVTRPLDLFTTPDAFKMIMAAPLILVTMVKNHLSHMDSTDWKQDYKRVTVGQCLYPYIKGDEVRAVYKVFDKDAMAALEAGYSTSPSVNSLDKDGLEYQIKDISELAIVPHGRWDEPNPAIEPVRMEFVNKEDSKMDYKKHDGERGATAEAKPEHTELMSKMDKMLKAHDDLSSKHDDLSKKHDDLMKKHDDLLKSHDDLKKNDSAKRHDDDCSYGKKDATLSPQEERDFLAFERSLKKPEAIRKFQMTGDKNAALSIENKKDDDDTKKDEAQIEHEKGEVKEIEAIKNRLEAMEKKDKAKQHDDEEPTFEEVAHFEEEMKKDAGVVSGAFDNLTATAARNPTAVLAYYARLASMPASDLSGKTRREFREAGASVKKFLMSSQKEGVRKLDSQGFGRISLRQKPIPAGLGNGITDYEVDGFDNFLMRAGCNNIVQTLDKGN